MMSKARDRGWLAEYPLRFVVLLALCHLGLLGSATAADFWGAAGHPGGAVFVGNEGQILFSTGSPHREYAEATVPDAPSTFFDAAWIEALNLFVAVGTGGEIFVSNNTEGNAWTERTSPVTETLRGVADFDGATRAVAVGDGGTVIRTTSSELGGWVTADTPTEMNLWDVVRNNAVSVAVGEEGTILKGNLDGTSWELVTLEPPLGKDLYGVSVEQDLFLAVGESGTILRGLGDGVSWTTIAPPDTSTTVWDVVGGGVQIPPAVAVGSAGTVWYSNDTGLSWQVVTTSGGTLRGVAYTGSVFIACGDLGTILWSEEGFAWDNVTAIRPTSWGRLKREFNDSR